MSNLQTEFTVPGTSVSRQRGGVLPHGGMKIECGCWTKTASTSFCMPTDLQYVVSVECGSGKVNTIPCVSAGYIAAEVDATFIIENYVAFGW
jgi:hypothetical protein